MITLFGCTHFFNFVSFLLYSMEVKKLRCAMLGAFTVIKISLPVFLSCISGFMSFCAPKHFALYTHSLVHFEASQIGMTQIVYCTLVQFHTFCPTNCYVRKTLPYIIILGDKNPFLYPLPWLGFFVENCLTSSDILDQSPSLRYFSISDSRRESFIFDAIFWQILTVYLTASHPNSINSPTLFNVGK